MNSVFIVLPILSLLMFDLGLGLTMADFGLIIRRPKALIAGLTGQLLFLPALAFMLATFFGLKGPLFVGLILIACCPGGSSSNVFSGIAKGDVALSVSLTAFSSVITLITLPLLMGSSAEFPVMNMVMQNLVLVLLPIIVGMIVRKCTPRGAASIHGVLGKVAFPALMLLACIFFVVNRQSIVEHFATLGAVVTLLVILGCLCGYCLGEVTQLNTREKRTLVIEVGMQNAAQAMALAASPFVFNNAEMAVPATIYALMMNVVLLLYVGVVSKFNPDNM